jgi:hypothetical protein
MSHVEGSNMPNITEVRFTIRARCDEMQISNAQSHLSKHDFFSCPTVTNNVIVCDKMSH